MRDVGLELLARNVVPMADGSESGKAFGRAPDRGTDDNCVPQALRSITPTRATYRLTQTVRRISRDQAYASGRTQG